MQYRPNLAARYLARRRHLRISVNTLKGEAFEEAVKSGANGIITYPSRHLKKRCGNSIPGCRWRKIEEQIEAEAYDKCRRLFGAHPDLAGIYVTTEASIPVIEAARDAGVLARLAMIATDLFPALVERIRESEVLATIDQRPHMQGQLAFRVLHQFLVEGTCPACQVTLSPHLVMRGNMEYFLQRQSQDIRKERGAEEIIVSGDSSGYAVG
jgi:hypothetical protein